MEAETQRLTSHVFVCWVREGAVAEGALRGGGEAARTAAGRRRQVPRPAQVPAAAHHLGRRGDQLLFQRKVPIRPARLVRLGRLGRTSCDNYFERVFFCLKVRAQSVPESARETRTGRGHGPDHHAGLQLVQKPPPEGPSRRTQGQVGPPESSTSFRALFQTFCSFPSFFCPTDGLSETSGATESL